MNIPYEIVDIEEGRGIELTMEYKIRNVPTLLFLDEDGDEIGRESGSQAYQKIKKYYGKQ